MDATATETVRPFVAYPFRPGETQRRKEAGNGQVILQRATARTRSRVMTLECSDYCRNFNTLWRAAHNDPWGFSHWAMCHDDVLPERLWLDVLLDGMVRTHSDVLSVVLPVKDHRGVTSTGIRDPHTGRIRLLTLKEIHEQLPETFGIEEVNAAGIRLGDSDVLLVNTGLWVVRISEPGMRSFPGFQTTHRIEEDRDGKLIQSELTEDWNFSIWAAQQGYWVRGTRKVRAIHQGDHAEDENGKALPHRIEFRNDHAWGEWDTDQSQP